jgi:ribosomal protein S18 acetylase RimI-like enzyme
MVTKYKYKKNISTKQLFTLYDSVGWIDKKDKLDKGKSISMAYKNSQIVISAWNKKELIGVIRAMTDKIIYGVIFGLVVEPKYQKHGIGKKMIVMCVKKYPNVIWYAGSENSSTNKFYKKIKFKKDRHSWFYKGV